MLFGQAWGSLFQTDFFGREMKRALTKKMLMIKMPSHLKKSPRFNINGFIKCKLKVFMQLRQIF